ncbi:MAG: protein kinase domain-containing protein [Acidobacteriota bacterium]
MTDVRARLAEIAAKSPASWERLIADAFPDDAALRAQALLWLRADRETVVASDAPPSLDERYVLATRLDAGASAAVWQAYDKKLGRDVAIKLFHADRSVTRALAEARAACDVISDYVVRVLDVHDGERPYIVMELVGEHDPERGEKVPGASAAHVRPRDIDEAVRWVRDIARGVHDAHLRDVFHRDLKPHNVLITPVSRRARIADFGLAVSDASHACTPEYMAPEQAHGIATTSGDRGKLVAIDVWGLGALAYDLVGGRPPWRTDDRASEPWELAASGAHPPPLSHVPPRLRRVIDKAMALDPARRYASAAELGRELDAYLARRPTSLDRSRLLRFALFCRRNPQLSLTAGAAIGLAALTAAAYVAVVDLRGRGRALADEVAHQEAANQELQARIGKTRAELAKTEADLKTRGETLATLERALSDEQKQLEGIIEARDKALKDADAATRALVEQLTIARSDREAAELGRSMYEGFWTTARLDAESAAKDRDQAQRERDAARTERDQLQQERDAARADRDQLQQDRDAARAEVVRLTAAATAAQTRIAELQHELQAASSAPADAGVAADATGSAHKPAPGRP